ncbi:hypothetical protein ACLOJK_028191 [Asimina triloba]
MGRRAHRVESRREEGEKVMASLRSALDAEGRFGGGLLLSEIDVLRAERDEAIRKATAAEDRALKLSTEPSILTSGVASPRARVTVNGGPEPRGAEVAWLQAELEALRAEHLQVGSAKGGDSLLMGSTRSSSASVIAECVELRRFACVAPRRWYGGQRGHGGGPQAPGWHPPRHRSHNPQTV